MIIGIVLGILISVLGLFTYAVISEVKSKMRKTIKHLEGITKEELRAYLKLREGELK